MALANNVNLEKLEGIALGTSDKEQLLFLGKQFFWVIYHAIDPEMVVFSWKKLFISKTWRWKDLHFIFEHVFGKDPFAV